MLLAVLLLGLFDEADSLTIFKTIFSLLLAARIVLLLHVHIRIRYVIFYSSYSCLQTKIFIWYELINILQTVCTYLFIYINLNLFLEYMSRVDRLNK